MSQLIRWINTKIGASLFSLILLLLLFACGSKELKNSEPLQVPEDLEMGYDSPDNWQFKNDNYWVCAQLVNYSAKTRYADGTPVATSNAYDVRNSLNSNQCGFGWIRLDHREILEVFDELGTIERRLVWHKGGARLSKPATRLWLD